MAKRILLTFVEEGISAQAELLESDAPRTCHAIWENLPLSGHAGHAVYSGPEIAFHIATSIRVEEKENQACKAVLPGDVGYYFQRGGQFLAYPDDISEICWFYDRGAIPSILHGPVMVNIFASLCGDASEFYELCRRMRVEGRKGIEITRIA